MEYVDPGYSSFEAAGAWHAVRSSTPHRSRNKSQSQLVAFCGRKWQGAAVQGLPGGHGEVSDG